MAGGVKKTQKNPYGLTNKQSLVVEEAVRRVKAGENMDLVSATDMIYDTGTKNSTKTQTYRNNKNPNFRAALLAGLAEAQVVGKGGKIERVLKEGLDARDDKGNTDFNSRLRYAQEINKIAGVYAPTKVESKSMSVSVDLSEKELKEKVKRLQDELG
jgi:hypothetical protein